MFAKMKYSKNALAGFRLSGLFSPLGGVRGGLLLLCLIFLANLSHAQSVPIPNWSWPLDSVINGAVKHFTVQGDRNYDDPSTFTWTVYGGRLFFDADTTMPAGDGSTVTVVGDSATNITDMWVVWDVFTAVIDTGYIYVTEVSADSCQKSDSDESKYQGMIIKVKAPPDVRFLTPETLACSNDDGVLVEIEIAGFAPFNIKYTLNGDTINWDVAPGEMVDSDFDGKKNNLVIPINDYTGTTVDRIYQLELLEASSEGVFGKILEYPTHTVYAFVQPDAPVISPDWTEVTTGESHTISLSDRGTNVAEWYWELYNSIGSLVFEYSSTSESSVSVPFNVPPGEYKLMAYYQSKNGCYSLSDTLGITVYPLPVLAFADSSNSAIGCSAVSLNPNDAFEFVLDYQGALSYRFTYAIYDYNNTMLSDSTVTFVMERNPVIVIPNTFINDLMPEIDRKWKVVILNALNQEGVAVDVLDDNINGGRDERTITIHPKPIIVDDIDFAN